MRILITGGSSGLGERLMLALIRQDHVVTNWDISIGVDLQSEQSIEDATRRLDEPVDCVINCAGINHLNFLEGIKLADWDKVMNVNVRAPWLVVKHLLIAKRLDSGHQRGTVLNIISNASHKAMTLSAAYNASKAALHMLTLQMARELMREHGVTVFGISPNRLRGTGMSNAVNERIAYLRGKTVAEQHAAQLADMPTGEETDPAVLADFIAYLLSSWTRHRYLHGCVIPYGA